MLRCLIVLAQHHGIPVPTELLLGAAEEDKVKAVLRLMPSVGLTGKLVQNWKWERLNRLGDAFPVMTELQGGYWIIVVGPILQEDGRVDVAILDPRDERAGPVLISRDEFVAQWNGRVILCKRQYKLSDENQPFGLRWFMPEVLRYRRYLRDVAILSIISANVALVMPLFFNILIDKVLPRQSYDTLSALIIIFLSAIVFDAVFSYVRQFLMLHISNKIDANLVSRTFQHMLHLPLPFFENKPAGVLIRNIQQTEGIRGFLVGRLFQVILDVFLMPVILVFLAVYSLKLTLVVLFFSFAVAGIIGAMVPIYTRKLEDLYAAEGAKQADLVETIHGMRTIKSLTVEELRKKSWDAKVVRAARCRVPVFFIGSIGGTLTTIVSQLMTLSVLVLGVIQIFDGTFSIGALVAFAMLSQRVSQPLMEVVGLINDYQQTMLSVKMLGEMMNHPPERPADHKGILLPINGEMEFDEVVFSYERTPSPALNRVCFRVEPGQMVGIVGRSGSGKTTVTRMIQGIHAPQGGQIRLSGHDIRLFDLSHLRRNIGVVLQDSFLFRGTIRDNIAAVQPDAPLETVMNVARLAGAAEFIDRLPRSYDTMVEEGASNFSGGQRQRIAIARALLSGPPLLILDEATSALDPDSEAIIQQNLDDIARGRTMIVISHRLSSLVKADAILVLERGVAVDFAPHGVLLERCDIYRHLWHQQNRHIQ